jgi:hypothetical protein
MENVTEIITPHRRVTNSIEHRQKNHSIFLAFSLTINMCDFYYRLNRSDARRQYNRMNAGRTKKTLYNQSYVRHSLTPAYLTWPQVLLPAALL